MKIKRVGTFSMGIVLISFGVILFVSQINKLSALNILLKSWPSVLVLIGLEILWYRYLLKDDNIVIKYDFFSIFIILAILTVNIGMFAISESGLINRILAVNYNMDAEINEYVIDEDISKIVLYDANNLVIRATDERKISGVSELNVYAASKEQANELASLDAMMYKKSGNKLYIYPLDNMGENNSYSAPRNLDVFIPENIDVEVINCYNMDLIFDDFNNKWTFDSVDNINIRLDEASNVSIKAFVEAQDALNGNIKWSFDGFGKYEKGDGDNSINIFNSSNVTVNEL